ncbi:MAG: hypothetical protein LWW85_14065 [Marinilabiliales bacterium]|nr:hypothetical protein [Marinilabiliales bacterium]
MKTPIQRLLLTLLWLVPFFSYCSPRQMEADAAKPRIVNVINFIRLLEPRDPKVTEEVLFRTVEQQLSMLKNYRLKGTFLLQYDALMDSRYQQLLKNCNPDSIEIGGWWEIPQPLVEKTGLPWRGRFPWDWHADVGFSTGYSPAERERLVDTYMQDFKKIFGYFPSSVGAWFIDAHTLNYLYEKYHIQASCNCKDQIGTDGYTLWGGYWNQAYYPSKINAYMPAQTEANQTPVPIFRMLGSDPIRQYDAGLGTKRQSVVSLEPVYKKGGGDSTWVNWYFRQFCNGESMAFAYVQAGQENSFTWNAMKKGFEIQLPLIARLQAEGKLKAETLSESGRWFKKQFKVTPATAVTVLEDLPGEDRKTLWFNSRFYRVNLLWEQGTLRIRDIHLFNENLSSVYTTQKATSNECIFETLPMVDGYRWSKADQIAGLRWMMEKDGKLLPMPGGDPRVQSPEKGKLRISWPVEGSTVMVIELDEKGMEIKASGQTTGKWFLDLTCAPEAILPFQQITGKKVACNFEGVDYSVQAIQGQFSQPGHGVIFRLSPDNNRIRLRFQ